MAQGQGDGWDGERARVDVPTGSRPGPLV